MTQKPRSLRRVARTLSLAASLGMAGASVQAHVFDFYYQFAIIGDVVTGSFNGDVNGDTIVNLYDIAVTFNGIPFVGSGALYGDAYAQDRQAWISGAAVASFDGLMNNFMFADTDFATNIEADNYFYFLKTFGSVSADSSVTRDIASDQTNGIWVVTEIPEPAGLAVVGLGLVGVAAIRRRGR